MLQAKLIVVGGEVKTQEVKLKLPTVIGRGKEANLKVPMALVSRKHCEIRERDGRLFIRDLGSLNGTYVNNYKITNEQPLLPGELITIGTVTFRADYQLLSPASPEAKSAAPEAKAAAAGKPTSGQLASSAPPSEEPIDFSPLVADRSTARSPGKRPPAVAAMDSTVAGTMSVTVSPGNPVKLSEVPSSLPHKPSAPLPPAARPNRPPAAAPKRDASLAPLPAAERSNAGSAEQHHALDDFPLETSAQKSISLSALEALQLTAPRQVSFIGDLNFGETAAVPVSDPVKLELGKADSAGPSAENPADSRLDSFLRRIAQPSE